MMTLDNWASVAREVIKVYQWAWAPFTVFVIISGFIVVNLIIAVICDVIGALHADEKAKLHGDYDENNTDAGDSQNNMEISEQLDTLADQMEELTRIQARTFYTLQYLAQQLQMHKVKRELQSKTMDFASAAKKLRKAQSQRSRRQIAEPSQRITAQQQQQQHGGMEASLDWGSIEIAKLKGEDDFDDDDDDGGEIITS
jgi:hypothetical protein